MTRKFQLASLLLAFSVTACAGVPSLQGVFEAQIFSFNESMTVWVAVSAEARAPVVGTTADGREIRLN